MSCITRSTSLSTGNYQLFQYTMPLKIVISQMKFSHLNFFKRIRKLTNFICVQFWLVSVQTNFMKLSFSQPLAAPGDGKISLMLGKLTIHLKLSDQLAFNFKFCLLNTRYPLRCHEKFRSAFCNKVMPKDDLESGS